MDTVVNRTQEEKNAELAVAYGGTPRKEFNLDLAISEYQNGVGLKALAKRFNVNTSTISRALKKAGVEMRGRGRPKKVA